MKQVLVLTLLLASYETTVFLLLSYDKHLCESMCKTLSTIEGKRHWVLTQNTFQVLSNHPGLELWLYSSADPHNLLKMQNDCSL